MIEPYVDVLLENYGFRILEKEYYNEHSIFYASEKCAQSTDMDFPNLYEQNKRLFSEFIGYHNELIVDLNKKIEASSNPIYLFGAHEFAQFLIAFGLDTSKIICLLDNGPQKIGKRLYGTNLWTESPKILKDKGIINIILKAGIYNDEIKKDILENINPYVNFWE